MFFTEICLPTTFIQCIKIDISITGMENNELSEYEACYRSSTPNNLTKKESTSIFLLTVFLASNPSTNIFSLANLSTNP